MKSPSGAISDASGLLKNQDTTRERGRRVPAAILPQSHHQTPRFQSSTRCDSSSLPPDWPCRHNLNDFEYELVLRYCDTVCCLSAIPVRFRLPYFNSVLLRICCDCRCRCRCSKAVAGFTSLAGPRSSTFTPAYGLPMPRDHDYTTYAFVLWFSTTFPDT